MNARRKEFGEKADARDKARAAAKMGAGDASNMVTNRPGPWIAVCIHCPTAPRARQPSPLLLADISSSPGAALCVDKSWPGSLSDAKMSAAISRVLPDAARAGPQFRSPLTPPPSPPAPLRPRDSIPMPTGASSAAWPTLMSSGVSVPPSQLPLPSSSLLFSHSLSLHC